MPDHTIADQVNNLNAQDTEKEGRLMRLRVERVLRKVPPPSLVRKKQIHVYICSMTTFAARELRDHLTACLEDGIPGPIEFGLHAREEL